MAKFTQSSLSKFSHQYPSNRQLTENIPIWAHYPQLVILNPQLGIIYQIEDWGVREKILNPQFDQTSPIGDLKYPIGHILC